MIVLTDKLWLYGFNIVLMEQVIKSSMSFWKSQSSCYPVMWMFSSRTSRNKLNDIPEYCLCLVTSNCDSNCNELLESSHEISIHKTCINYLMIEVFKYLHGLSPELMTHIFPLRKNSYNIRNIHLLYSYKCIFNTDNL